MQLIILADSPESFRALVRSTIADLLPPAIGVASADHLLTIDEACAEFGISKPTLAEWKKRGIVPFLRLGRRVYFERAKLLEAGRNHTKRQRTK